MSSFTSPLWVTPMPNGRDWKLLRPFTYHLSSYRSRRYISVPRGFVTDFASVPRLFFFLPDYATYHKSAILHDWLYHVKKIMGKPIEREAADIIYLEAMMVDWRHRKSRYLIATLEYLAVRLFGWVVWRRKTEFESSPCSPEFLLV